MEIHIKLPGAILCHTPQNWTNEGAVLCHHHKLQNHSTDLSCEGSCHCHLLQNYISGVREEASTTGDIHNKKWIPHTGPIFPHGKSQVTACTICKKVCKDEGFGILPKENKIYKIENNQKPEKYLTYFSSDER